MFLELRNRLILGGSLVTETAFRIGAGRSTAIIGTDLPVVRDIQDKPYIPGSSFKGVLRSRLETLVRTVCNHRRMACIPTENAKWCITDGELKDEKGRLAEQVRNNKREYDARLTEWIGNNSCLLCLTCGSPWIASRTLVRDLLVDEDLWYGQFQIRNGVAIDRDTETASKGKLYDFEVVPSGTRFDFKIIVENGEPWQWGMLFCGLRAFEMGAVPIGGGKSRGLGWVKLKLDERKWFSLESQDPVARQEKLFALLDGTGFQAVTDRTVTEWVDAFRQKIRERAGTVRG